MFTDRCECYFVPLMTRFAHRIKMYRNNWLVAIAPPEPAKNELNDFPEITTKKAISANTEVNILTNNVQTKRWKIRFAPLAQRNIDAIIVPSKLENTTKLIKNLTIIVYKTKNTPLKFWILVITIGNIAIVIVSITIWQTVKRFKYDISRSKLFERVRNKYDPPPTYGNSLCDTVFWTDGKCGQSVADGLDWMRLKQHVDEDSLEDDPSEKMSVLLGDEYGFWAPNVVGYREKE